MSIAAWRMLSQCDVPNRKRRIFWIAISEEFSLFAEVIICYFRALKSLFHCLLLIAAEHKKSYLSWCQNTVFCYLRDQLSITNLKKSLRIFLLHPWKWIFNSLTNSWANWNGKKDFSFPKIAGLSGSNPGRSRDFDQL